MSAKRLSVVTLVRKMASAAAAVAVAVCSD